MSLEQKTNISNLFIWMGVLAWAPYLVLRLLQQEFSVLPFLIVHIFFITGGIVLRKQASVNTPPPTRQVRRLKTISTILLVLEVSVWGVYFAVQWLGTTIPSIGPFLTAHLSGVLSGAAIKLYLFFTKP